MPNFLLLTDSNLFPLPEYRRTKGGSGGLSQAQIEAQMKAQEDMMTRQMEMQKRFQLEAEERMKLERERERQREYLRREEAAASKEASRTQEEKQEAALFREMTGQTNQEDTSDFGGGFNLDMPTIERPDYEQQSRPI